ELLSLKVCQQKSKRDGLYGGICGGILAASSVLIGYMVSYKSFSTCMADVRLKQQLRKEDTERISGEVSRDQLQESVFTDPYNADDSKSGSKD
ncbi:31081_t:CDS:2, partial [Gigaspora margarita]